MKGRGDINNINDTGMGMQPMFSVVITTLNRVQLLKRALNSLLSQTESDWEALIIDDGGTDNTYSHILPYLESYPKIRYLWKPHSGAVLSKNMGIQASGGKYVTFLDSDDEYDPVHLESRKTFLLQHPDIKFLYGGVKILGNQYVPDKNNPSTLINLNNCVIGGTYVIEREVFTLLKGFNDIALGSDSDFFERAKKAKVPMAVFSLPTYIYHHENPDSITNKMIQKMHSESRPSDQNFKTRKES